MGAFLIAFATLSFQKQTQFGTTGKAQGSLECAEQCTGRSVVDGNSLAQQET